jgi:hypothetical protein
VADSAPIVEAVPDGERLASLIERLPLSRGSVFELVKALGIETEKGPGPGGRGRVAWLSAADVERLEDAAREVAAGRLRIADAGGALATAPQRLQTPPTLPTEAPAPSGEAVDGVGLLDRIAAAEGAMRLGFPLSTAEVGWILGARPGGPVVTRAGLQAERLARNVWRLQAAGSGESADAGGLYRSGTVRGVPRVR